MPHLRTKTDRWGDTWKVWSGPDARRIRREVEAEFIAALDAYEADRTPEKLARCEALFDTEKVIGERLAVEQRRAAA